MRRDRSVLLIALSLLIVVPARADVDCGCGATDRPCVAETLATVAVERAEPLSVPAVASQEMVMVAACADCGSLASILPFLLLPGMFLPVPVALVRMVRGPSRVLVLGLTARAESGLRDSPVIRLRQTTRFLVWREALPVVVRR